MHVSLIISVSHVTLNRYARMLCMFLYEILLQVRSIIPAGTSFVDDCGKLRLFLTGFLSFTRIVCESHYIHII